MREYLLITFWNALSGQKFTCVNALTESPSDHVYFWQLERGLGAAYTYAAPRRTTRWVTGRFREATSYRHRFSCVLVRLRVAAFLRRHVSCRPVADWSVLMWRPILAWFGSKEWKTNRWRRRGGRRGGEKQRAGDEEVRGNKMIIATDRPFNEHDMVSMMCLGTYHLFPTTLFFVFDELKRMVQKPSRIKL